MKQSTVIYHSADYDGIFCREIAKHFLGTEGVEYIGWNFGDKPIPVPDGNIYILDLPMDQPFGAKFTKIGFLVWPPHDESKEALNAAVEACIRFDEALPRIIWIDHHKSAIESHPKNIPGYRIDGVAACRLAWQWFSQRKELFHPTAGSFAVPLPTKQDFIDRQVSEPLAVRLAGEYDIWDKRDERSDIFQFGLDCGSVDWDELLQDSSHTADVERIVNRGRAAKACYAKRDADVMLERSFFVEWEGLKFLALTTARCNSLTFAAKDIPETGHDALLGFYFNGKTWTVSLYHAKHRMDLDLSLIAVKHGGGGHRGACGFTCEKLPFAATNFINK